MPDGLAIRALDAAPPSPECPHRLFDPTMVVMFPLEKFISRTTQSVVEVTRRFPCGVKARRFGRLRDAEDIGPPSPFVATVPVPATVTMLLFGKRRRTREPSISATYKDPSGPSARPSGDHTVAATPRPPSPVPPVLPLPARVTTVPFASSARTRCAAVSAKNNVPLHLS